jgi:energy-coupling factor transporter transmembrane protein EcfT
MGISAYLFNNSGSLSAAKLANLLIMRYLSIALISYSFAIHTPFAKLFDYLIEHKICSVKIGYSLFAAFNSLIFLSEEFKRIQTAYKMRYGKNFISPLVFISLLTTAARYAHNLSISMYCRGINHYKTFVVKTPKLNFFNYALWLINLVIILAVIYTIN